MITQILVIASGIFPLAVMLACLFAAVWIRDTQREREAVASRPHS